MTLVPLKSQTYLVFLGKIKERKDLPGIFGKNERKKRREHVND